jgi:gas vesicle protein
MSENGGEIGAFMAGFVIGGLTGAVAALMMTPQSGAETRAQIAAKGEEWRHSTEEQFNQYRSFAESTVDDMQERARIVLDEGKARVAKREPTQESEELQEVITEENEEGDASE